MNQPSQQNNIPLYNPSSSNNNNNIPFYNSNRIFSTPSSMTTIPHTNNNDFSPNNTVVHHPNDSVTPINHPIPSQNNNTTSTTPQNTVLPQESTVSPQAHSVPTNPSLPNIPIPTHTPPPSRLPIPTSCPPPRRSTRLAALQSSSFPSEAHAAANNYNTDDYSTAFLTEFSPLHDSHYLLPVTLDPFFISSSSSLGEALTALATGHTELTLDPNDNPLWATAITSSEHKYWIAGARDELQSLKDLNVFVLVPRSDLLHGQRPLKGKLVCKQK